MAKDAPRQHNDVSVACHCVVGAFVRMPLARIIESQHTTIEPKAGNAGVNFQRVH